MTGGRHAKNRFYAVTDVVIQCMDSRPSPHSPLVIQDDSNLSEAIYSLIYRGNAHVITRASVFILKIPSPGGKKLVKDMLRGFGFSAARRWIDHAMR